MSTPSPSLGSLHVLPDALLTFLSCEFFDDVDAFHFGRTSSAMMDRVKKYRIRKGIPMAKLPVAFSTYLHSLSPLLRMTFTHPSCLATLEASAQRVRMGVPTKVIISEVEAEAEQGLAVQLRALPISVKHVHVMNSTLNRSAWDRRRAGGSSRCARCDELSNPSTPEPLPPSHVADLFDGNLPEHIESLTFEHKDRGVGFDEEDYHVPNLLRTWDSWRLPDSLRTLGLPRGWISLGDISKVYLPPSLTCLGLPQFLNVDLSPLKLPSSLRSLRFGDLWTQDVAKWPQLPTSIQSLELSWSFPFPIRSIPFPRSLQSLRFVKPTDPWNRTYGTPPCALANLSRDVWPPNLKELWLPDHAYSLNLSLLPSSLKILKLTEPVSQSVTCSDPDGTLPCLEFLQVEVMKGNNGWNAECSELRFQGVQECKRELNRMVGANVQKQREQDERMEIQRKYIEEQQKRQAAHAFLRQQQAQSNGAHSASSSLADLSAAVVNDNGVNLPAGLSQADMDAAAAELGQLKAAALVEPHAPGHNNGLGVNLPFDVLLHRVSSAEADAKSYVLQMLQSYRNPETWYVWVWWGNPKGYLAYGDWSIMSGVSNSAYATNTSGRLYRYSTLQEALQRFHSLFQRKTGVNWNDRFDERAWQTRTAGQYSLCDQRPDKQQVQNSIANGNFTLRLASKYLSIPRYHIDSSELLEWDPLAIQLLRIASKRSSVRSLLTTMRVHDLVWSNLSSHLLDNITQVLEDVDRQTQAALEPAQQSSGMSFRSLNNFSALQYQLKQLLPEPMRLRQAFPNREIQSKTFDHFRHCLSVLTDLTILQNILRDVENNHAIGSSGLTPSIPELQTLLSDDENFASDDDEPPAPEPVKQFPPMSAESGNMLDRAEAVIAQQAREEHEQRTRALIERQEAHYARRRQVTALIAAGKVAEVKKFLGSLVLLPSLLSFHLRPVTATLDSVLRSAITKSVEAHQLNAHLRRNTPPAAPTVYPNETHTASVNVSRRVPHVKHLLGVYPESHLESTTSGRTHLLWFVARLSPARLIGILTTGLRADHGRKVEGIVGKVLLFSPSLADVVVLSAPDDGEQESVLLLVEVDLGTVQDHPFTLTGPRPVTLTQISTNSSIRMRSVASSSPSEGDIVEDSANTDLQYSGDSITSTATISACSYRITQAPQLSASTFGVSSSNVALSTASTFSSTFGDISSPTSFENTASIGSFSGPSTFGAPSTFGVSSTFGTPAFGAPSISGRSSTFGATLASSFVSTPSSTQFGDPARPMSFEGTSQNIANSSPAAPFSPTVFPVHLMAADAVTHRCQIRGVAWLAAD